ncbi:hypothetical protein [Streptomyces paromomycinus]|uniref:Uncharacterized protein n=1 Tax=Streptomyces paromomycinus TaxID=92743 RepID=A0A401W4F8_STREY|nr:hypothetical protein [Streptomyces paromomycinus]GCD44214.1 hypothetical protein GKJPGBOP_03906 [Streptomyces paromomycinus]
MGNNFSVDTGELGDFMRTLKKAHESLEEVRNQMNQVTSDRMGTTDLDQACNDFQEHWKYGSEQIAEQTKKLTESVSKTKDNYEEVERSLEEVFKKATGRAGPT